MGISREVYVYTTVTCDECGKEILSWNGDEISGMSKGWAKYNARKEGTTVGKTVTCKECRIEEKQKKCSLIKKIGNPGKNEEKKCYGFGFCEKCKRCIAYIGFDWNEEAKKFEFKGI